MTREWSRRCESDAFSNSTVVYLERRPMTINKELITACVPIALTPAGMSKQSVRKSVQRAKLRLIALSTDVDDHSLTAGHDTVMWNAHVH